MKGNDQSMDAIPEEEFEEAIRRGEATEDELDEKLQEEMRRRAAERESLPDPTQRHTAGGFGSGQGMGTERTGQEPDRPDEQGEPRGDDIEWPT